MTNIIMCHKKVDDRGALCGWPRLSEYNECGAFACVHVRVCQLCMSVCSISLQAILLMFPAVNPLLG